MRSPSQRCTLGVTMRGSWLTRFRTVGGKSCSLMKNPSPGRSVWRPPKPGLHRHRPPAPSRREKDVRGNLRRAPSFSAVESSGRPSLGGIRHAAQGDGEAAARPSSKAPCASACCAIRFPEAGPLSPHAFFAPTDVTAIRRGDGRVTTGIDSRCDAGCASGGQVNDSLLSRPAWHAGDRCLFAGLSVCGILASANSDVPNWTVVAFISRVSCSRNHRGPYSLPVAPRSFRRFAPL